MAVLVARRETLARARVRRESPSASVKGVCEGIQVVVEEVAVHAKSERSGRVAKHLLNGLRTPPCPDHPCCGRVSERVHPDSGHSDAVEQGQPHGWPEPRIPEGKSPGGCEQKGPRVGRHRLHVSSEQFGEGRRDGDRPR